jgi:protein involved in polysaccharide export with SLBB domain
VRDSLRPRPQFHPQMNPKSFAALCATLAVGMACSSRAADPTPISGTAVDARTYVLSPNDVVEMRVYQEDDLQTKVRVAKDGTVSIPLIGVVHLGGRNLEEATRIIRDRLDKDYLVNPQVSLSVVEYAKRRFTVLGQVQKPGTYEIPGEESVTLLQAVAMAGGYTRLANPGKITVSRTVGAQKSTVVVDGRALASDASAQPFSVRPEDTITVAERIF